MTMPVRRTVAFSKVFEGVDDIGRLESFSFPVVVGPFAGAGVWH
jgi:hypothetical protein